MFTFYLSPRLHISGIPCLRVSVRAWADDSFIAHPYCNTRWFRTVTQGPTEEVFPPLLVIGDTFTGAHRYHWRVRCLSLSLQKRTTRKTAPSDAKAATMGSAGHLCPLLLTVFLLGLHHSVGFWIVNVVFPPNAKPKETPSNSTPPVIIGKCGEIYGQFNS